MALGLKLPLSSALSVIISASFISLHSRLCFHLSPPSQVHLRERSKTIQIGQLLTLLTPHVLLGTVQFMVREMITPSSEFSPFPWLYFLSPETSDHATSLLTPSSVISMSASCSSSTSISSTLAHHTSEHFLISLILALCYTKK